MSVTVQRLSRTDAGDYIEAVRASRSLHHPWIDPPDSEERFQAYLEVTQRPDLVAYVFRHDTCGGLVGYVNVANIVRGSFQSATVGYGAFSGHSGRGLMAEGMRGVLANTFGELGLHRLEANIQPGNAASIALVRRLGFEKEGFSPRFLIVDGDWRDHERWALRAEVWSAARAAV